MVVKSFAWPRETLVAVAFVLPPLNGKLVEGTGLILHRPGQCLHALATGNDLGRLGELHHSSRHIDAVAEHVWPLLQHRTELQADVDLRAPPGYRLLHLDP